MGFLPTDYSTASIIGGGNGGGKYFKLQPGTNQVRILGAAIVGYMYWTLENKPVRSRTHPGQPTDIRINDDGKPDRVKHFWAVPVWDYANECVCVWEITQKSIQEAIEGLYTDEDWGDPKEYDIKIKREGEKLETKYNVIASPKKPVPVAVAEEWAGMHLNLNRLYTGGDPFQEGGITNEQLTALRELRESAGMSKKQLLATAQKKWGVADPRELTEEQATELLSYITKVTAETEGNAPQPVEEDAPDFSDIPF